MTKEADAAKAAGEDIVALAEEGPDAFLSTPPPSKDAGTVASASVPEGVAIPERSGAMENAREAEEDDEDEPRLLAITGAAGKSGKALDAEPDRDDEEDEPRLIAAVHATGDDGEEETPPAAMEASSAPVSVKDEEDDEDEPDLVVAMASVPAEEEGEEEEEAPPVAKDEPSSGGPLPAEPSLNIPIVEGSVIQRSDDEPEIEAAPASESMRALVEQAVSPAPVMSRIGEEASIPPSRASEHATLSDTSMTSITEAWITGSFTVDDLREFFREHVPFPAMLSRLLVKLEEAASLSDDESRSGKAAWCRGCVMAELIARGQLDDLAGQNVRDQEWFVRHGAEAFLRGERDPLRERNLHHALEFFQERLTQHTGMAAELAEAAQGAAQAAAVPSPAMAAATPPRQAALPPEPQPPAVPKNAPVSGRRTRDPNRVAMVAGGIMLAAGLLGGTLLMSGSKEVQTAPAVAQTTAAATDNVTAAAARPTPTCVTVGGDQDIVADCTNGGSQTEIGEGRVKLCGCTLY